MALDSGTPVLVGTAAVQQRCDDSDAAREPVELMIEALQHAAADAGSHDLLRRADSVRVPRGFWDYADPARIIKDRLCLPAATTQLAEIGVLQTTLLSAAAQAIANGSEDVVLVAGGEAKFRESRAAKSGKTAPLTTQLDVAPDSVLQADHEMFNPLEMELGLMMPVTQYSIIETALRHAEGKYVDDHQLEVARLWAEFSRIASQTPCAWNRNAMSPEEVLGGRMLAFPYTSRHTSQWNVDQAAGLIFCSVATARELGIAEERWIFPLAIAESNYMLPLAERAEMHRSYGFRRAGRQALEAAGLSISDISYYELYSCFPVAVRVQVRELGVPPNVPLTVTGGMAFAGGPLNSFVLQAMVRMVEVLRHDRGSNGMVTAISGLLTKQGVSLWSSRRPQHDFQLVDVTKDVAAATATIKVVDGYTGPAMLAAYTVLFDKGAATRTVAICDLPDGNRTLAETSDAQCCEMMTQYECCGRRVQIAAGRKLHLA